MSQVKLEGNKRDKSGKGVARKLRAQGRIPGVLYGQAREPISLEVEEKALALLMKEHGLNPIIELTLANGGGSEVHTCMIADYQKDVFQRFLLHVDLKHVNIKDKITAEVRIIFHGETEVRSRGGIVQQYLETLTVNCLPLEIPKVIELDIANKKPGEQVTVSKLTVPAGVEVIDDPETVILSIFAPKALATTGEGEAGEGTGGGESAAAQEGGEAEAAPAEEGES